MHGTTSQQAALIRPAEKPRRAVGLTIGVAIAGGVAVALIWPFVLTDRFVQHLVTLLLLYSIGATSVHLIVRCGHVSLCQAAFMGIAAYTSVLLVMKLHVPWIVAAGAGVLAASLTGLIIGPIIMRLAGKYFVLVTFLFGEIVRMVFVEWISLTGGANGISDIPPPARMFLSSFNYYYLVLAAAALMIGLAAMIMRSQIGRTIDAMREGEQLALCSGVPTVRLKVIVYTIACGMIGVQGVLQAHFVRYIEPLTFGILDSLNLVVMNVIGGMTRLPGPILGAIFIVGLPELLREYVLYQRVIFGIILIVVMAFLPGGLSEVGVRLYGAYRKRGSH